MRKNHQNFFSKDDGRSRERGVVLETQEKISLEGCRQGLVRATRDLKEAGPGIAFG